MVLSRSVRVPEKLKMTIDSFTLAERFSPDSNATKTESIA